MARSKIKWRKWNNIIHRDLGYLCVGLTVVYAVSGVAVNHIADWNPNYRVSRTETNLGSLRNGDPSSPATIENILELIGAPGKPSATFRPDTATLEIFLDEGTTVSVDLRTGDVVQEHVRDRRLLREANFLHLNHARQLWTYVADLYAAALALLAVSGMFVLKGKKGMAGRGAWLTGVGILVPLVFLWLYL